MRHFVAEEQYLYPLLREQLDDGEQSAEAGLATDRACEQALRGLESPRADAQDLSVTLAEVRRLFAQHVGQQQELFAALREVVPAQRLAELADEVLGAEQLAPTRPRVVAPANPAVNKVSSLLEGFIDRVRGSYAHRGADEQHVD